MLIIENTTVVDGEIQGDNLILITREGTQIDAGSVRGPIGPVGPKGISVPLGTIIDFYGTTAPAEYLECNGGAFDPLVFPDLNAHLSGNTLPDLRDMGTISRTATFAVGQTKGSANATVPEHQHSSSLAAPAHQHPFTSGPESARHIHHGNAENYWMDGPPNMRIVNNGTQVGINSLAGVTTLQNETTHTHSGNTGNQTATALSGSIGNVLGAAVAAAGANYHPVMAVLKCIKATL